MNSGPPAGLDDGSRTLAVPPTHSNTLEYALDLVEASGYSAKQL
jgi:hypothetical protein